MPNPNLDNGSFSDGAPLFEFSGSNYMSPIELARWIAAHDPSFFVDTMGGDLSLFTVDPSLGNYVGTFTGPQEIAQNQYLLSTICPWMMKNRDLVNQEQVNLGLCMHDANGTPYPNLLFWDPAKDAAIVATGFGNGSTVDDAWTALLSVGYDPPTAARLLNSIMAQYGNGIGGTSNIPTAKARLLVDGISDWKGGIQEYTEEQKYFDLKRGEVVDALPQGQPYIPFGNEPVYVPLNKAAALYEAQQIVLLKPTFQDPKADWVGLVKRQQTASSFIPALRKYNMSPMAGAGTGFSYLTLWYRLKYGPSGVDTVGTMLAFTVDALTRFLAVPIEAEAITQECIAISKTNKYAKGMMSFISNIPRNAADDIALRASPSWLRNPIPPRIGAWLITGYNGFNPALVAGAPGSETAYSPDYTYIDSRGVRQQGPKTSSLGRNAYFVMLFEGIWRAQMAFSAVNGLADYINMGTVPGTDDGSGNPLPAYFGTLLAYPRNPDKTRAFPFFSDTKQYRDLPSALKAGLTTSIELANAFMAVVYDPPLRRMLGLAPASKIGDQNKIDTTLPDYNADVANDFYTPNNIVLRDSWLAQTLKPATLTLIPDIPAASGNTLEASGRYGTLNILTA